MREWQSIEEIKRQLTLPIVERDHPDHGTADVFDPWEAFPCLYGSYSSEFDDMAILVLDNVLNNRWGADNGEELAHEMFREMLCTARLCDYGTSPRGCFPDHGSGFAEVLPALLDKWREYRRVEWEDDAA